MSIETHTATLWHGGEEVNYTVNTVMTTFVPAQAPGVERVWGLYGKTHEVCTHPGCEASVEVDEVIVLEQDGSVMPRDDWRWERLAAQVLTEEESHREWSRTTMGI